MTKKKLQRPREGSLHSKLLQLSEGQSIYLDDVMSPRGPTRMESTVYALFRRSDQLGMRRFTLERWLALHPKKMIIQPILRVTRRGENEDEEE